MVSDSKRQTYKYCRKRLSSRPTSYAPMTFEDIRWLWAEYRLGKFDSFKGFPKDIKDPIDFAAYFEEYLLRFAFDAYILSAEVEKDSFKPIGIVLLWTRGRLLDISNFVWFNWATNRSKLAAAVNFLNQFRSTVHEPTGRKYKLIGFTEQKDRAFFERICEYKVLRPIGRSYDYFEDGENAMVYETR